MHFDKVIFYLEIISLVLSYDNLSYRKVATQSHTYLGHGYMYDASNALDGNTGTCMRTQDIGGNSQYMTVWWKVDLGGVYRINSINILFRMYDGYRNRQQGRLAGFSLYVSNNDISASSDVQSLTLCYKDSPQLPSLNITTTCIEDGRYVIFYNERLNGVTYPESYEVANVFTELCEVTVQGRNTTCIYGDNCDIPCPVTCKDSICQEQNGSCFDCKPGWLGSFCNTACREGWYGVNCSQKCVGHCRDREPCNHVTGLCNNGCDAGRTGYTCTKECDIGTFGYDCVKNCHCLNISSCDKITGHCDGGCTSGYINTNCSTKCPYGYFGMNCTDRCSGHCINNDTCDHVSGECSVGCQDGYIGIFCNDTCNDGYYGSNCSRECHPNCGTCRHTDGVCTCESGWIGPSCNIECVWSFGEDCQYPCSRHCLNQTCDRYNGSCVYGSSDEYMYCELDIYDLQMVSTPLVVGISLSVLVNMIVISVKLLRQRKTSPKQTCNMCNIKTCWIPNTGQSDISNDDSHYQELEERKKENVYQNMALQ